jgi:murein DD-endopeptidase MepM/ murein hydrolase activator NlpD
LFDPTRPVPVPLDSRSRIAVALALAFTAVVGVASVNPDPEAPIPLTTVESLPLPALAGATGHPDESVVVWDVLGRGDTLFVALARLGILDPAAAQHLRHARDARPFVDAAPGTLLRAVRTGEGMMLELAYISAAGRTFVMTRDGDKFRVTRDDAPARQDVALRTGPVGPSIFKSFADAGVPRTVADQVIRIFSRQFDLHAVAGEIERFAVVFDRQTHGLSERPGRVLGVELVRAGKPYRAFWFAPEGGGRGDYFGPEGFSLEREFLPAPLEYTEITSWFGVSRQIGRRWQSAHPGIDYAAPIGTPVHATADGTVEFLGAQGGYGNLVVLKHRATLSTYYAHLHGFAEGLVPGTRVRQGELVGYVGRTGWATGPHLHYELRVDDKPVNPEEHVPVAEALSDPERIARFRQATAPLAAKLDLLGVGPLARFE